MFCMLEMRRCVDGAGPCVVLDVLGDGLAAPGCRIVDRCRKTLTPKELCVEARFLHENHNAAMILRRIRYRIAWLATSLLALIASRKAFADAEGESGAFLFIGSQSFDPASVSTPRDILGRRLSESG
jgi:hypothetical protein